MRTYVIIREPGNKIPCVLRVTDATGSRGRAVERAAYACNYKGTSALLRRTSMYVRTYILALVLA